MDHLLHHAAVHPGHRDEDPQAVDRQHTQRKQRAPAQLRNAGQAREDVKDVHVRAL
jgi:hypothetical protein